MTDTTTSAIDHATDGETEFGALSPEEWWECVDRAARYYLGMSANEFRRAWRVGAFGPDPDDVPGVMEVGIMLAEDDWLSCGG